MTAANRQNFLERVRKAGAKGNRPGDPELPLPHKWVGRSKIDPDLVTAFCSALQRAGGVPHVVETWNEVGALLERLVREAGGTNIALAGGVWQRRLDLDWLFRQGPWKAWQPPLPFSDSGDWDPANDGDALKRQLFAADVGITGADWLIAETGSVVLLSRPDQPRSVSLLPRVHIAVAESRRILPDLYDLFQVCSPADLTANLTIITGPSKTGDIELKLVTGVHGPEQIHVVVIRETTELAEPAVPLSATAP